MTKPTTEPISRVWLKPAQPEQLDRMLRISSPCGWLAARVLAGMLIAACVWSVVDTAPLLVTGQGVLLPPAGIVDVVAPGGGRLTQVLAQEGDRVRLGQVVARLVQPDIDDRLARKRHDLESLAEEKAAQGASRLIESQKPPPQLASDLKEAVVRRELAGLEAELAEKSVVKAPADGEVVELAAAIGDTPAAGTVLCRLVPATLSGHPPASVVQVFVSPGESRKIRPGMAAQVIPSAAGIEGDGLVSGTVTRVAALPSSRESMVGLLKSGKLADRLYAAGASYQVTVRLETDESGDGPRPTPGWRQNHRIEIGTPVTARLEVDRVRVIALMIPRLALKSPGTGDSPR